MSPISFNLTLQHDSYEPHPTPEPLSSLVSLRFCRVDAYSADRLVIVCPVHAEAFEHFQEPWSNLST